MPVDLPAPSADPLAALLRSAPPLGAWVADAACAGLDEDAAAVFTSDDPDVDDLAAAEAVCWRCPVRAECADYAAQVRSWGLWGADWHHGKAHPRHAARRKEHGKLEYGERTMQHEALAVRKAVDKDVKDALDKITRPL